jgi:hypothetical protein
MTFSFPRSAQSLLRHAKSKVLVANNMLNVCVSGNPSGLHRSVANASHVFIAHPVRDAKTTWNIARGSFVHSPSDNAK